MASGGMYKGPPTPEGPGTQTGTRLGRTLISQTWEFGFYLSPLTPFPKHRANCVGKLWLLEQTLAPQT